MPQEGDRVELVSTSDPHTAVSPGDRGTVTGTDSLPAEITGGRPQRQVWVDWDDYGHFALLSGEDSWRVVEEDEDD